MSGKVITCILLILFMFAEARAQSLTDLELISAEPVAASAGSYYGSPLNNRAVMETHRHNVLAGYNPAALLLKGTMFVYQHVISPQLSRGCPYEITCSNFSKQSIREFGIVKGVFLSADRILRCNRIGILDVSPLDINEKNGKFIDPPNKYR
jgi:putative component of membrane protein insertase Oxa1/YidC/SpoIIIJ protein YidD